MNAASRSSAVPALSTRAPTIKTAGVTGKVLAKPAGPDGTQFRGTLPPYATEAWFTYNWPEYYFVAAEVVPTTPGAGPHPSRVKIERPNGAYITYLISISNLTNQPVSFEAHYDILGR